jgi:hypothetical protein
MVNTDGDGWFFGRVSFVHTGGLPLTRDRFDSPVDKLRLWEAAAAHVVRGRKDTALLIANPSVDEARLRFSAELCRDTGREANFLIENKVLPSGRANIERTPVHFFAKPHLQVVALLSNPRVWTRLPVALERIRQILLDSRQFISGAVEFDVEIIPISDAVSLAEFLAASPVLKRVEFRVAGKNLDPWALTNLLALGRTAFDGQTSLRTSHTG